MSEMIENPKVFLSYSHDSEEHKEWVYKLATALMEKGIDTILDQWDLELGANLAKFMENGLLESDRVLVVCTDNYNKKSNDGLGGVGYENNILTSELMLNQNTTKFIPVVRAVSTQVKTPRCLATRMYIDLSDDSDLENSYKQLIHEIYGLKLKPKPKLGKNPFIEPPSTIPVLNEDRYTFFHARFSSAFPGVRSVEWFEGEQAIERLKVLLKQPLEIDSYYPIWWWRDGDLQISKFEVLDGNIVLLNQKELMVNRIAAVNCGAYYQSFVYVETDPMEPTGLYEEPDDNEWLEGRGYYYDEYAIFGEHLITREEFDDGATVIDGKPVDTNDQAELRVRYTTPYNFVIAAHSSPINNTAYDRRRRTIFKEIILGKTTVDVLINEVLNLPRRSR